MSSINEEISIADKKIRKEWNDKIDKLKTIENEVKDFVMLGKECKNSMAEVNKFIKRINEI